MAGEPILEESKARERQWKINQVGGFIRTRLEKRIKGDPEDLEDDSLPDLCTRVINSFEQRMITLLPIRRDTFSDMMNDMRASTFHNSEELVEAVTTRVTNFIVDNSLLDELERGIRDYDVRKYGWTMIDRVVGYEVLGAQLMLRVPQLFLQKRSDFPKLFVSELKKLAEKLSSDPGLAAVETIEGAPSRPNYVYAKALRELGFEVICDDKRETASTKITAEQLKKTFGIG